MFLFTLSTACRCPGHIVNIGIFPKSISIAVLALLALRKDEFSATA